jgi:hypothetical protein
MLSKRTVMLLDAVFSRCGHGVPICDSNAEEHLLALLTMVDRFFAQGYSNIEPMVSLARSMVVTRNPELRNQA